MGSCSPQLDTQCWGAGYMAGKVGVPLFSVFSPLAQKTDVFLRSLQSTPTIPFVSGLPAFFSPPHLNTLESGDVSPARPRDAKNGDS